MDQRLSISFMKPDKNYTLSGSFVIAVCLGRYMILSHLAETPIQFINKMLLTQGLTEAYEYATKLDNTKEFTETLTKLPLEDIEQMPSESKDLTETMSTLNILAMKQSFACVVAFKETNNCLLVVGHKKEFYVIDVANNIFYQTDALEYDINHYKYGSEQFEVLFLSIKEQQTPKIKKEKVAVTKKPKIKKEKEENK